ncbi:MAG: ferritin-like domain-containing protein [Ginsengibacter sp.]
MNLQNIISEIEKVDPEVYGRLDSRRKAMKKFANLSGKVALASLPIAFGSMLNTAYATPGSLTDAVTDTLNFALTLEYLEAAFYNSIVGSAGYLTASAADQAALTKIKGDENAHVAFLKGALGASAVASPVFDLTGGKGSGIGPFAGYLASYPVQLAMAQTFEDTGVRAYKGQAPNLQSSRPFLTAALNIHSVEARHASHIRYMRRTLDAAIPAGQKPLKPWITLNYSGIDFPPAQSNINLSFAGEEVTTQAGVNIVGIGSNTFISDKAASEAFDEPLTKAQVLIIVDPFIV